MNKDKTQYSPIQASKPITRQKSIIQNHIQSKDQISNSLIDEHIMRIESPNYQNLQNNLKYVIIG